MDSKKTNKENIHEMKSMLQSIIDQTVKILEKHNLGEHLSRDIVKEFRILLDEYMDNDLSNEEKLLNAKSWGGGVWDRLYHYHDQYKSILVINYLEIEENSRVSPVYASFPWNELNSIIKV